MKIMAFGGGLGNQVFEYAVYLYIKNKYPHEKIWGYYNKHSFKEHNGLEIDKYFDVSLPQQPWWADYYVGFLFMLKRVLGITKYVDTGGSGPVIKNEKALFISAYRDNKDYFPDYPWIKFKKPDLEQRNTEILYKINKGNSFFIHVRRGDYFSKKYKWLFDGCCTLDYYQNAINMIKNKYPCARFFLFSNDIDWSLKHLNVEATVIDWNTGDLSYLDMYLMSQCDGGIIANSTFSYWGAFLGKKKLLVTYPIKWSNSPYGSCPNIFPDDGRWIGI